MMAEGGLETSAIHLGSDVECEYTCTPCADDGSKDVAIYYCPACSQWLCSTCTKYHKRIASSKNHQLVTIDEFRKLDNHILSSVINENCPKHQEREVEMYCGTHDMVYCALCIAKDHRSCSHVEEIVHIIDTHFSQSKYETLVQQLADIHANLGGIITSKEENIKQLKCTKMEISKEQQGLIDQMISHLKHLKILSDSALDEKQISLTNKLELEIANCETAVQDVEKYENELNNVRHSAVTNRFVKIKLGEQLSSTSKKIIASIDKTTQEILFIRNKVLRDTVLQSTSLGQVREGLETSGDASSESYHYKHRWLTIEASVMVDADIKTCNITGVCCLPDGTIILADLDNKKLKRLDRVYNVQDCLDLGTGPMGLCCLGANEVVVKLSNDEMQVVRVGKTMSVIRTMSIEGGGYFGIATCNNNLWVCAGSFVNVYNGSGLLLNRLDRDEYGTEIFEGETQNITVSQDESLVYIPDYTERALIFNQNGEMKGTLSDTSLDGTSAVCISTDGTVFVAAHETDNIVMFGKDGESLGEVLTSKKEIGKPVAICFERSSGNLIVGFETSNNIQILQNTRLES